MKGVCLHWYDWSKALGYYCKDMQKLVLWNSSGFEDVARSHFLFLAWLGRGGPY